MNSTTRPSTTYPRQPNVNSKVVKKLNVKQISKGKALDYFKFK